MSTPQWFMAIGGHQVGPVTQDEISANLRNGSIDAETLVFTAGMPNWHKIKDVPAFAALAGQGAAPGPSRSLSSIHHDYPASWPASWPHWCCLLVYINRAYQATLPARLW